MSEKTTHTPGPWIVDQNGNIYGPYIDMTAMEKKLNGLDIDLPATRLIELGQMNGGDVRPGDATLVAAANDLLDASKAVIEKWDDCYEISFSDIDLLKTAVAKAEGGAA